MTTRVVEVSAAVRDKNGPVANLTRDDFTQPSLPANNTVILLDALNTRMNDQAMVKLRASMGDMRSSLGQQTADLPSYLD